jgi:hypothetical protein
MFNDEVKHKGDCMMEVLSAAKAPKYDGKGNKDGNIQKGHFALKDAMMTGSRKALIRAFV